MAPSTVSSRRKPSDYVSNGISCVVGQKRVSLEKIKDKRHLRMMTK